MSTEEEEDYDVNVLPSPNFDESEVDECYVRIMDAIETFTHLRQPSQANYQQLEVMLFQHIKPKLYPEPTSRVGHELMRNGKFVLCLINLLTRKCKDLFLKRHYFQYFRESYFHRYAATFHQNYQELKQEYQSVHSSLSKSKPRDSLCLKTPQGANLKRSSIKIPTTQILEREVEHDKYTETPPMQKINTSAKQQENQRNKSKSRKKSSVKKNPSKKVQSEYKLRSCHTYIPQEKPRKTDYLRKDAGRKSLNRKSEKSVHQKSEKGEQNKSVSNQKGQVLDEQEKKSLNISPKNSIYTEEKQKDLNRVIADKSANKSGKKVKKEESLESIESKNSQETITVIPLSHKKKQAHKNKKNSHGAITEQSQSGDQSVKSVHTIQDPRIEEILDPDLNGNGIYALVKVGRTLGIQLRTRFAVVPLSEGIDHGRRKIVQDLETAKEVSGAPEGRLGSIPLTRQIRAMIERKKQELSRNIDFLQAEK